MATTTVANEISEVREIHEYPPMLQACHIKEITGFSNGKTYELMRSEDCPTVRRGKRMIVPRDLFWQFLLNEASRGTELEGVTA